MHVGTSRHTKKLYGAALVDEPNQAQRAVWRHLLHISKDGLRVRREVPPTGGQPAVAALVKSAKVDAMGYATVSKTHAQVPMDASRIVEPSDERVVDMLQALPQDEREFYAHEENVVELLGKSSVIQQELEQQYAFVGGSLDEYLKYFHRQDIPTNMWEWKRFRDVKAVAGFSVVPKKDGRSQRKLLMCCSFNYLLCDPRNRSSLGMQGAGALTRIHVAAGDKLELAACDQSNAFTRVAVPTWMIPYLAAPPITAAAVWDLLPAYLRATISESDLVSPCYKRLPMGCSHSVHILMMINLQVIGRSLRANALVGTGQHDTPPVEEPNTQTVTSGCDHAFHGYNDDEWWSRFQVGVGRRFESGYSVQEWWDAIRAARSSSDRTIVVMYFFGGERRDGDVQEHVEKLAAEANLKVLMITVDLGCDSRWDVAQPETFHEIMRMLEGYVDIIVGGPPCSTVSRARHRRGGEGLNLPRPLRFRSCPWGRAGLTTAESGRLREANRLWLHFMMACEKVSARGGCHLFEHPQDPGVEPFPSIWITPEMIQLELRTKAQRVSFDQCACGAPVKKGTTVSGTLDGIGEFERFQCPGVGPEHLHSGHATGLDARGSFRSRRLQAYPQAMCELLARCIVKSARRMVAEGSGPTGYLLPVGVQAVPTAWSFSHSQMHSAGVDILNEQVVHGRRTLLSSTQAGVYLHVDDTLTFSTESCSLSASNMMHTVADSMEEIGFVVPERVLPNEVVKVIGYAWSPSTNTFSLPPRKRVLLQRALRALAVQRRVEVTVLRAVIGLWSFGAQLRRDLYAVPFVVYNFIDKFDGLTVRLWPSVRQELIHMATAVDFMFLDVSMPFSSDVLATDAMGYNEIDHGGFGICVTKVDESELAALRANSEQLGLALNLHDDVTEGMPFPDRALTPTIPFSLLPAALFSESRWTVVLQGRWKAADHISIGETRAVWKALRWVTSNPERHGTIWYSLQDNMVCKAVLTRGRSSSWGLNMYCRKKAALCLAARIRLLLPWVQTSIMPADAASRNQE